jgi:hypothetical protein
LTRLFTFFFFAADPSGYGHKGGETAKERNAGIMADPAGYGSKGGKKGGRAKKGGRGEEEYEEEEEE